MKNIHFLILYMNQAPYPYLSLTHIDLEALLENDDFLRDINIDDIIFACTQGGFLEEDFICSEQMPYEEDFNSSDMETLTASSGFSDSSDLMDVDDILALFKDD